MEGSYGGVTQPLPRYGVRRNSTETQQSGHTQGLDQRPSLCCLIDLEWKACTLYNAMILLASVVALSLAFAVLSWLYFQPR